MEKWTRKCISVSCLWLRNKIDDNLKYDYNKNKIGLYLNYPFYCFCQFFILFCFLWFFVSMNHFTFLKTLYLPDIKLNVIISSAMMNMILFVDFMFSQTCLQTFKNITKAINERRYLKNSLVSIPYHWNLKRITVSPKNGSPPPQKRFASSSTKRFASSTTEEALLLL